MPTYAIGDLQGCLAPLHRLLARLRFDARRDRLWFTGDLVNRGPESLGCLRFVRSLGDRAVTVLGNHDLHLLAAAATGDFKHGDTLDEVMRAPDRDELLEWLRRLPLLHEDNPDGPLMLHAGLPPQWDRATARALARETEVRLRGPRGKAFLREMYGDRPDRWDAKLSATDRARFAVNCFTRLRYVDRDGRLHLKFKGAPADAPAGVVPWFKAPGRRTRADTIVCGHWSMLGRVHWRREKIHCLDTGCVWGNRLTAMNLDSGALISTTCQAHSTGE